MCSVLSRGFQRQAVHLSFRSFGGFNIPRPKNRTCTTTDFVVVYTTRTTIFYVAPSFDLFFCMRRLFILSDKNVHNRASEGRTNIRPAGGVATRLLLQTNQIEKSLISFRRHPDGKKVKIHLSTG